MKISEQLIAARALIATPAQWMQNDFNETKDGVTCYCSIGAMYAANSTPKARRVLALAMTGEPYISNVVEFNDAKDRTHAEVLAKFDEAIADAQADEAKEVVVNNLTTLIAAVEAQPEDQFDLSSYQKVTTCGTLFCTAGLAATMPSFQAQGLSLRRFGSITSPMWVWVGETMIDDKTQDEDGNWFSPTDNLFGSDAWANCFSGRAGGRRDCEHPSAVDGFLPSKAVLSDKQLAVWRLQQQLAAVVAA